MAKGKQGKGDFGDVYLQGKGPGVVASRPFLNEEKEEVSSDEDTSHLSDERWKKHSPSPPPIRKKKRSYSFVR